MNVRKNIIRAITFFGGLYFVLEFLLPAWIVEKAGVAGIHDQITYGFIAVGAMAFGLGIINLFMVHGAKILYLRRDWFFSVVLLTGLVVMGVVSSMDWYYSSAVAGAIDRGALLGDFALDIGQQVEGKEHKGTLTAQERFDILTAELVKMSASIENSINAGGGGEEDLKALKVALSALVKEQQALKKPSSDGLKAISVTVKKVGVKWGQWLRTRLEAGTVSKLYTFLVDGLFNALGAAMFSLLSVYIAAAAFRAFRIRSWESSLMMMAAIIVILGQTPFGLWIWDQLPVVRQWLMEVPNSAAFRAIKIGSGVAGLVMAFRMWLSIESESFS